MISIQKVTQNDAAMLAELAHTTFMESHGNSAPKIDIDNYVQKNFSVQILENEILKDENNFNLIFVDEKLAGFSNLKLDISNGNIENVSISKLERIYILKQFYDLKIGYILFKHNIELAKENHQLGIWLNVWKENKRAIEFYTRNGFIEVGETEFRISDNHSNPNFQMYLEF